MVLHILSHRAEPFYMYRRHFLERDTSNKFVLKQRLYKFLDTNDQCNPGEENRAALTCYYNKWLRNRLIEPYNCTLFYLQKGADGYETCDPDLVVSNYDPISDTFLKDTKVNTLGKTRNGSILCMHRSAQRALVN